MTEVDSEEDFFFSFIGKNLKKMTKRVYLKVYT